MKEKFATFSGRARRSEYWYFQLFQLIVGVLIAVVLLCFFSLTDKEYDNVSRIAQLVFLIPSWAVLARRLHDTNHSGWWFLIVFTGVGVFVLLYWLIKDGDVGDNRYGEDPKVVSDDEMRGLSIRKDEIEKMGGDSVI